MAKVLDNTMPDLISTAVMVELEAKHKQRIFGEGKNSEGGQIGEYSKKAGYYAKNKFVRTGAFTPQGKERKGNFKNGKERKTMYLAEGYSELRDIQGRQTEYVDVKVNGSLERSIGIVKISDAVLYGVRDAYESKKLEGLNEQFGDFASLSNAEKEFTKEEITNQAVIVLKEYGK